MPGAVAEFGATFSGGAVLVAASGGGVPVVAAPLGSIVSAAKALGAAAAAIKNTLRKIDRLAIMMLRPKPRGERVETAYGCTCSKFAGRQPLSLSALR
jgi:hypothetical protein